MIEIPQAHLILGKQNDMVGERCGEDNALAPLAHQRRIHRLQRFDPLLEQHGHEFRHNEAADIGIIGCTVVIEGRQLQRLGHSIQLMAAQLRHQLPCQR